MATRQRTTAVNNALRIAVQLALLAQNSRAGSENQFFSGVKRSQPLGRWRERGQQALAQRRHLSGLFLG